MKSRRPDQINPETIRLHPDLDIVWRSREEWDGTMYFEPVQAIESAVVYARPSKTTRQLQAQLRELGVGSRGVVLQAGDLAIKRCTTDRWPGRTDLQAVAANAALATALNNRVYQIGDYRLRGCMPRGYNEPRSLSGHPTWIMDVAEGQNAEDMVKAPVEATERHAAGRDAACRLALRECGLDPDSVFLDTVCSNVMVDIPNRTLTVIDVMAGNA